MKVRIALIAVVSLLATFLSGSSAVPGQQSSDAQHEQHHPARAQTATPATQADHAHMAQMMAAMKANDQKLDDLVKKMNTLQGTTKVDAMAELLTTLVQDRRTMHESMTSHMSMMMEMGQMRGRGAAEPQK
jgi:hypothetical protein